jgi:hypothetical protein
MDGKVIQASQGMFIYIPVATAHTFSVPGDAGSWMLAIDTPGGLEPYYEELARAFPEGSYPDQKTIAKIQSRYDTYPADL